MSLSGGDTPVGLEGVSGTPGDGPYAVVSLTLEERRISSISCRTNGCPSSMVCGSVVEKLMRGRLVEEARRLEPQDIITFLGGLPEGKEDSARRPVEALMDALKDQ